MNEAASRWFETNLLSMLGLARQSEIRQIVQQLTRAAVNQHSCIYVSDKQLQASLLEADIVGEPGDQTPLIFDENRLYLARFYRYEQEVAEMISARNLATPDTNAEQLKEGLEQEFGVETGNRQKLAAFLALTRNLTIITGGPGTGKTSTVVKILRLLLADHPDLQFRLAAPTGKAAMRLGQSISAIDTSFNTEVQTIHRLLGMRRDGRSFRHGPDNQIVTDVLIVDEASMIDLAMMHRLLNALPTSTRLILLGDPNQLPSVDTGNVLADLCVGDSGFTEDLAALAEPLVGNIMLTQSATKLTDSICELDKSYRFSATSGIGNLAKAIESGSDQLSGSDDGAVSVLDSYAPEQLINYWQNYLHLLQSGSTDADALIESFEQVRVLCSRRGGTPGVDSINASIEKNLETSGLKQPGEAFYHGRPVLITRNDYNLGLYNGDIGLCLAMADAGQYLVHFPDGRQFLASRIPEHETCFAMTVHKSQGSEFDKVILMLPEEAGAEAENLMNRELLYTAVTRAKSSIVIITPADRWQAAMNRSAARTSGMQQFLRLEQPKKTGQLDLF